MSKRARTRAPFAVIWRHPGEGEVVEGFQTAQDAAKRLNALWAQGHSEARGEASLRLRQ